MNATETIRNQYLAFEHPFSMLSVAMVGILCASIMLITLSRERFVLGGRTTALFSVLRVVAIATVLWMLLAPTNVLEESTKTRKAVLVVADVSASMTTVDPQGTSDDRRWITFDRHTTNESAIEQAIAAADRSVAALGVAQSELTQAIEQLERHGAQTLVTRHLTLVNKAIDRTRSHLKIIVEVALGIESDSAEIQPLLLRLTGLLETPEFDSLSDLANTMRRGGTPDELGWREGLPDLISRIVVVRRVFQELAGNLVSLEASATGAYDSERIARFHAASRSERLAAFLDHFRENVSGEIERTADLRFSVFDDVPQDLGNQKEATTFLAALTDREHLAKQTDLASALRHVRQIGQQQPIAATFVLSDVAHNHSGSVTPTEAAGGLDGAPVYVVPIGNPSRLRDVDLVSVSAPTVAMRNDDVVIEAHLEVYQCLGETCTVELLRDGQVVDFRNLAIDSDSESRRVRFDQRVSEIGRATFQIAVQPLDGEMTTENNFDEIEINVTRSGIKVLLADELPRWEYRYLVQLFRRDDKVELDELLFHPRLIATGRREATGAFPVTSEQWNQYDVVILGDLPVEHFPVAAQEALMEYLRRRGGTLIMIAGDRAMPQDYLEHPIHDIVPVRQIESGESSRGFTFRVTDAGRSHTALMIGETEEATRDAWDFVNRFSPLHQVSLWRSPLPTARSLIAAVPRDADPQTEAVAVEESSFLCWQAVGRGRVVYLSSPDTYRLRFLRGDRLHHRFWGQLMRWAIAADLSSGNRSVRIRTEKTLYETDSVVDVQVELIDREGEPVVRDELGRDELLLRWDAGEDQGSAPFISDPDRPGHYHAELRALPPGVYQVQPVGGLIDSLSETEASDGGSETEPVVTTFTVQADLPTELVDTRCNRVLAGQVAELTGGQVLPPTAVDEILRLTDLEPVVTHRVARQPLWLRWRYLWLVFGCLQTEWMIRKWRGLS